MNPAVQKVLSRLEAAGSKVNERGGGWQAQCPAHDDARASLSIANGRNGGAVIHCQANCKTEAVLKPLGLSMRDLMPPPNGNGYAKHQGARTETAYEYRDEEGHLLYQSVRREPKSFYMRQPDGKGGWIKNMDGARKVIYRLPDVLKAISARRRIYVVEGEKDADALWKIGLAATTNVGGAGKWRDGYSESLRGADVAILPDNDEPGHNHGESVARGLQGIAASVKMLLLPDLPVKGDVSDWLKAGGDANQLEALADGAGEWGARGEEGAPASSNEGTAILDSRGNLIPLNAARAIKSKHPSMVYTDGEFWDFTGKIFESLNCNLIDRESIGLISSKARRSNLADIRHLLSVQCYRDSDFFKPGGSNLILVENGALDLASLQIQPHGPEYRGRNLLPVVYDPSANCPRFQRAMEEWLPDDPGGRELLEEWMGYCLLPDTSQEKMLFLIGEGGNGKGRYIRILENLLGRRNISGLPLAALRSDRTFPSAGLVGKLVNICPESELSGDLDEGWLKSLVSGDSVEVERKGRDPFTMRPTARFIIQSNNPPHLNDKSEGIWRRLIVVRFTRTFDEAEQDRDLDAKLANELAGIFNVALSGLRRLRSRGSFEITQSMRSERDSYRKECNPLVTWADECLSVSVGAKLVGKSAYQNYRDWCRENGHSPYSQSKFTRELKRPSIGLRDTRFDLGGKQVRGFADVCLA